VKYTTELQKRASRKNGRKGGRPVEYWCSGCRGRHKLPHCTIAKPGDRRVIERPLNNPSTWR